jgi:hypothetical protein
MQAYRTQLISVMGYMEMGVANLAWATIICVFRSRPLFLKWILTSKQFKSEVNTANQQRQKHKRNG